MARSKVAGPSRSGGPSRGGIRKRGAPTRTDRDGDLDMGASTQRGRGGKRARGHGPSRDLASRMELDRDRIRKAISSGDATSQANIRQGVTKARTEEFSITGWKESKASTNSDGGIRSLIDWLEKKLFSTKPGRKNIIKHRVEGDTLVVTVRPELVDRMSQINGFTFAGAELTVEKYDETPSISTDEMKKRLKAFLANRFLPANKILNLQNLAADPILLEMGLFKTPTSETKFYQALMKVWSLEFPSEQASRDAVENLSLANNGLTNINPITTLSQNFPNLKALDLSNNNIQDEKALDKWRWKFRQLEFIDLTNNPFSSLGSFKDTMMKWYPKLKTLNNIQVRTDEEVAAQNRAPIPVQPPFFKDEGNIAETFIRNFFLGFDKDRNGTLNLYYDNNSSFSYNVNPVAPRSAQDVTTTPAPGWDSWIKGSRNLKKIHHLAARMSRMYVGIEKIRDIWNTMPQTQHPGLDQPAQWLIECHLIPCLPDATGQSPSGVGGFLITIHGQFDESSGGKVETRSFDRTFILGPSPGPENVKVISDMLTLRAYGGYTAWDVNTKIDTAPAAGAPPAHPEAPQGYGMPAPGKPDVQVQQEQLVLQLSFATQLKLEFSQRALVQHNWSIEGALRAFEESKAQNQIPAEAFVALAP
ncbi:hypothetical protein EYB25_007180 [Talaromyces marneffei]|uniref:mRNA export factor MEX67 n=1 Tax=Talaromyces marneffei (strain ATCC 18224 / CBS 334.59 / QM 7333) TaxID=441960 RepID=B6QNS6_TALMQ|nr:uncharacterized protein EYB26_008317 [Talaromyces marneffei]EEA21564.1 mRNA export factor mex67 [Talaromyces marneffei ATCC 18224]KAE8550948.1 hypothetical protein EYB25_007180 [Talaromyces marneffei]QGA20611.1 hypothetical protein EYB26_008317 [Talaromyces marneffei]